MSFFDQKGLLLFLILILLLLVILVLILLLILHLHRLPAHYQDASKGFLRAAFCCGYSVVFAKGNRMKMRKPVQVQDKDKGEDYEKEEHKDKGDEDREDNGHAEIN